MIPDRTFLHNCTSRNNRILPPELENWLMVHFEDEPYEDFYDSYTLEGLVCLYCDNYAQGKLDISIPTPYTRLKERYEDLKDLISDLRSDIDYLDNLNNQYRKILEENNLI